MPDAVTTARGSRPPLDLQAEKGQTMVELTLVAPFVFMLLFAVIQFGILYNNYITLTDATRVGARKAAVSRQAANPVLLAETSVRNAASDLRQGDLAVFVNATAWAPGADVTVEARYPYDINLLGMVVYDGQLTSKTTERVE